MAKVIVAWCDVHMIDDEEVPGRSFVLSINEGKPVEIDLCEQHEKELVTPLQTLLGDVGQPVQGNRQAPGSKVKPFTCPECSKGLSSRDSFGKHLRSQHGIGLPEAEAAAKEQEANGPDEPYACPDCARSFQTPQGRGAHRTQVHGYESPTRGVREAAAARQEDDALVGV